VAGQESRLSVPPRPIGVFDSGVGGLTVVAALRRRLPGEPILYLGDTARLPYGIKTAETVRRYTRRNVEFLVERGVRAVVVACNTASAVAVDGLEVGLPLWGVVEPGARRAAESSAGRVGVIGTESTILSDAYPRALRRLRPELEIASQACPLFVPLVEEGWHEDEITEAIARRYLAPLLERKIDTLVLGCTHYPLLKPLIQRVVGEGVRLVDSAQTVAETVARGLAEGGMHGEPGAPEHHFCVTDGPDRFGGLARRILGDSEVSLELVEMV
jgi:glutamate racemase